MTSNKGSGQRSFVIAGLSSSPAQTFNPLTLLIDGIQVAVTVNSEGQLVAVRTEEAANLWRIGRSARITEIRVTFNYY